MVSTYAARPASMARRAWKNTATAWSDSTGGICSNPDVPRHVREWGLRLVAEAVERVQGDWLWRRERPARLLAS